MRDLVNKKSFLVRKQLDNLLYWLFPSRWVPLYTSVTFSRMRYSKAAQHRNFNIRKNVIILRATSYGSY